MLDRKARILVADDDFEIRQIVRLLLQAEGYEVVTAENGLQAVELANDTVDLYILDVGMPLQSGIIAASKIREQFAAPIIFLTAYSGESDKVIGFSVGADDYIVKPFSNAELLMRIRAILRRTGHRSISQSHRNHVIINDLILDLDRQHIIRDDIEIPLTYTEFQILALLAQNRKKVFSPDHIYQHIWNDNVVGNDTIMVHIKNIRKKIGDNSRNPIYIKTAWGKGYYID